MNLPGNSQMHKIPLIPVGMFQTHPRTVCQEFPAQWGHPGQSSGHFIQCNQKGIALKGNWSWVGGSTCWPAELLSTQPGGARPAYLAAFPGRSPSLKDGSLLPPPGEPGKMPPERAVQADFERKSKPSHFLGSYDVPEILSHIILSLFFRD